MLDEHDNHGGAPETDHSDRLKGEMLGTLSALKSDYKTERLELAWSALQSLLKHIERVKGLEALIEFSEKAGAMLTEDARDIRAILDQDFKERLN